MGIGRRLLAALLALFGTPAAAQVRGERDAVAAAGRLLDHAGGRQAWAGARMLYMEERAFMPSGEIAEIRSWRDLDSGNRRLERSTPTSRFAQWLSHSGGWEKENGTLRRLAAGELLVEFEALRQEPYSIYRRIALGDQGLRVQLRENTLYVYDRDDELLCWFLLDGSGAPRGWGTAGQGRIVQHQYGPIADLGGVALPKWAMATTGGVRVDYVRARLETEPLAPPVP